MARLTFERDALVSALAAAGRVRSHQRDTRRPGLVKVTAHRGVATILSGNYDMFVEAVCSFEGDDAELLAPLDALAAFAGKAPDGALIELLPGGESVQVRAGRARSTLNAVATDAPPRRPTPAAEPQKVSASALVAGLRAAVPATDDSDAQPYLGGVHMSGGAGGVAFSAQDGNRVHVAAQDGNRVHVGATIPWRSVDLILALVAPEGEASIAADDRSVMVETDRVRFVCSLIDCQYPSVAGRLEPVTSRELSARADQLLADIDLVMVVSDPRNRDFRFDLAVGDSQVSTFRMDGDAGAVRLEGAFTGAPLAIGFQYGPVRDALMLFGGDVIRWRMGGPEDPTTITSEARPGLQTVLSPYRLLAEHQRKAA